MNIDLTAAEDAAYRGWRSAQRGAPVPDAEFVATFSRVEAAWMAEAVAAAAPLIAAQVAERIARAIEAERTDVLLDSDGADTRTDWLASGLARAARIAREWSPR